MIDLPDQAALTHIDTLDQSAVSFEFAVGAARAAVAFRHPYAYAALDREDHALAG